MIVCNNFSELTKHLAGKSSVGYVPTMGNLHRGHLSLVTAALEECAFAVVSIYVNPLQFAPHEDLQSYPRSLVQDQKHLSSLPDQERIILFCPENIYQNENATKICVSPYNKILCGVMRPQHFDGVTTVLFHLLQNIRPQKLFLGAKDFQQYFIVKKMVHDLKMPVAVIKCPIVRTPEGLALSSRNQYLDLQQQNHALFLYRTLQKIASQYQEEQNFQKTQNTLKKILCDEENFEYLELYNSLTLSPLRPQESHAIILGAYRLGKTRLIDNIEFTL